MRKKGSSTNVNINGIDLPVVPGKTTPTHKGIFAGLPQDEVIALGGAPIIQLRKRRISAPSIITVGTLTDGILGANQAYHQTLIHPAFNVSQLPSTTKMAEVASDATAILDTLGAKIILLTGGDDLGPYYTQQKMISTMAEFYGINDSRDRIEESILKTVKERDNHFFIGVCRGMQILIVELTNKKVLPRDVKEHQPQPNPTTGKIPPIPDTHPVRNVLPAEIGEAIGFPNIKRVSSLHHQGIYLDELIPHLESLAEMGWYVALVATEGNTEIVEALVKVKKNSGGKWVTLGVAVQGHPERPSGQHNKTTTEWKQAESNNENFAKWLLEKQKKFTHT